MRRLLPLFALVALTAGCSLDPPSGSAASDGSTTVASDTTVDQLPAPATTVTSIAPGGCPPGDVMLADGRLLAFDRSTADSTRITGITWRMNGQCQVITVSFATEDGAPATSPPTLTARLLSTVGVLRVETETTQSAVVDQLVEEGSVERLFVPMDDAGNRFIDFVLSGGAVARARVLTSPAQLEIELGPGEPDSVGHPLITDALVVVEPGSAAEAQPLLDLTGYSIGPAQALDVSVERNGEVVESAVLELEDSPYVWTAFHHMVPVGVDGYDTLRIVGEEGGVVAVIPFSR